MLKSKFSNVALFLPVTAFTSIGYARTPAQVDQTLQRFCGALEDEQNEVKNLNFLMKVLLMLVLQIHFNVKR